MSQQRITNPVPANRAPWSPISVCLSALLFPAFPAGAAILTIRNLERLGQLERPIARQLIVVTVAVFALGFGLLVAFSHKSSAGVPTVDPGVAYILSIGVCIASYLVQRLPFRAWRAANSRTRPSSWLAAIGMSAVYELIVLLITIPILTLALLVGGTAIVPVPR